YCRRIRKYVGAYYAVLGRVDAIAFTAGVGENDAATRAASLAGLDRLGIAVDPDRNTAADGGERAISPPGAEVAVLVIPTDEEWEIARQAMELICPGAAGPITRWRPCGVRPPRCRCWAAPSPGTRAPRRGASRRRNARRRRRRRPSPGCRATAGGSPPPPTPRRPASARPGWRPGACGRRPAAPPRGRPRPPRPRPGRARRPAPRSAPPGSAAGRRRSGPSAARSRPPRPHGGHPELHRGPLPRPAVELPPAAGDLGPLPHLDQPEMPPSRGRVARVVEAHAVVADLDVHALPGGGEPDPHRGGAGVLADVRQGLLADPEHGDRDLGRRLLVQIWYEVVREPGPVGELLQILGERFDQAAAVEPWRMQVEGEVAQAAHRGADRVVEPQDGLGVLGRERGGQQLQAHADGHHRLDGVVVHIPGDAPPLLLLG